MKNLHTLGIREMNSNLTESSYIIGLGDIPKKILIAYKACLIQRYIYHHHGRIGKRRPNSCG